MSTDPSGERGLGSRKQSQREPVSGPSPRELGVRAIRAVEDQGGVGDWKLFVSLFLSLDNLVYSNL